MQDIGGPRVRAAGIIVLVIGLLVGPVVGTAAATPSAPTTTGTVTSYEVYDRTTRTAVQRSGEHRQFRSASLVKILIALDYLQTKGSTAAVSRADLALLRSMLRSSDDDAASTLWVRGGYEQIIKRMVPKLGLVDTLPPTDRRYWGYTALSAADVVTTYTYLLDRAPASFRDEILGDLEGYTRCAADGFDQSFGVPRAVAGTKAVKQGWSGYGAHPTGPACVEGRVTVPAGIASTLAPAEAPPGDVLGRRLALAAPSLDLSSRAMHTSGLVDGRRRIVVVLTLSPTTTSFGAQSDTVTALTRQVHDQAVAPAPVTGLLGGVTAPLVGGAGR